MSAPRCSARLLKRNAEEEASTATTSTCTPSLDVSSTLSQTPVISKPKRKKRKMATAKSNTTNTDKAPIKPPAAWAKIRGKRGHLKFIIEMPFDILLEIFKYLMPVDLLNLSKANRSIRALLLDRPVALPVWKNAFSAVEPTPPPCPEDLNLPQYANLLYGRTCFFCDAIHGLKRSFTCYVRYCKECVSKFLVPVSFVESDSDDELTEDEYYIRAVPFVFGKNKHYCGRDLYLRTNYETHMAEVERLKNNKTQLNKFLKEEKEKCQRRKRVYERYFVEWEYDEKEAKKTNIDVRRKIRTEAFYAKIRGLGYGQELDETLTERLLQLAPAIKGVKPLTNREWEKLRPRIVEVFEGIRTARARVERLWALDARSKVLNVVYHDYLSRHRHVQPFAPRLADIVRSEPFRNIIYDTPPDQEVTQADFLAHQDEIPRVIEAWKETVGGHLLDLLSQVSSSTREGPDAGAEGQVPGPDLTVLNHATSLFSCLHCDSMHVYPNILFHRCLRMDKRPAQVRDNDVPDHSWNPRVFVSRLGLQAATNVIDTLGEDPDSVTWRQLDEANQRLECLKCRGKPGDQAPKRLVMNWRHAIIHELRYHLNNDGNGCDGSWEHIPDPEALGIQVGGRPRASWDNERKRCIECELCLEDSEGQLHLPPGPGYMVLGESTCRNDHDLSMGTYSTWYESSCFNMEPHPVKIPL